MSRRPTRLPHPRGLRGPAAALTVVAALAASGSAAPTVVETDPLPPEAQRAKFRLPAGFEIQLVAAEPEIQKPMNIAFDARGRLWVTHSVEYPWAAADDAAPRDGLTILADFAPDGRARQVTRFADRLNIPIGVLPLPEGNGALVWSIPHIWKLSDDDGDGRADRREVLYGPFGFVDTHGNQNAFRLAADGWVYANHGFKNQSQIRLGAAGPVVLELCSGNGYRFRADGSAIEQVSWGQVNPFGMDFDALGNRFNADCHSRPLTMLLRGGRYLSPFGRRNADFDDGLGLAPETTADGHGSTGIAAVAICDTPGMPAEFQGSAFVGNVVTNVIHRDPVAWRGSSPWVARAEEFLRCDDQWFRPVDLAFGPDGALYVADFYNCIIGHYEVDLNHPRRDRHRGRIWRIVRTAGSAPAGMPDLTRLSAARLVELLDAPDEVVRRLAFEQVVVRGRSDAAVGPLLRQAGGGEHRRARSVGALARLGLLTEAEAAALARDPSRLVRTHFVRAAGTLAEQDPGWRTFLVAGLADPDPFVRRAAAEALVNRPALAALPALLSAVRGTPPDDPQLVHALRMAIAAPLRAASPEELAALPVAAADRLPLLEIVADLPGQTLAGYGLGLALTCQPPPALVERVLKSVGRGGDAEQLEAAAAFARDRCGADLEQSAAVVRAVLDGLRESRQEVPAEGELAAWARGLFEAVAALPTDQPPSDRVLEAALLAGERLSLPATASLALRTVRDAGRPLQVRAAAAGTALAVAPEVGLEGIAARLADPAESPAVRVEFAKRLAGLDSPPARAAIAAALRHASAAEQLDLALAAIIDREGAEALLGLVARGQVSARLLQDPQIVRRLGAAGLTDAEERIRLLTDGLPAADQRVRELIRQVAGRVAAGEGSAAAGATVFAKSCAACHRRGSEGGLVGPQLDGVGQRTPERLLEDILDPNRNIDEAFRTTVATLVDGRAVSGLRSRDEGEEMILIDAGGRELRVSRADIEELCVVPISPMPANMAEQLGEAALADLVAFLRAGG